MKRTEMKHTREWIMQLRANSIALRPRTPIDQPVLAEFRSGSRSWIRRADGSFPPRTRCRFILWLALVCFYHHAESGN